MAHLEAIGTDPQEYSSALQSLDDFANWLHSKYIW